MAAPTSAIMLVHHQGSTTPQGFWRRSYSFQGFKSAQGFRRKLAIRKVSLVLATLPLAITVGMEGVQAKLLTSALNEKSSIIKFDSGSSFLIKPQRLAQSTSTDTQVPSPPEIVVPTDDTNPSPQEIVVPTDQTNTPPQEIVVPVESQISSVAELEQAKCQDFKTYFGNKFQEFFAGKDPCKKRITADYIQSVLRTIVRETGKKSSIIYISEEAGIPERVGQLRISAFFPEGAPVDGIVSQTNRAALLKVVEEFRNEVAPFGEDGVTVDVEKLKGTSYLDSAQQLYRLLIAPLEKELKARDIDTLVFAVGGGLRSLPFAALHDGKQFLAEKYSLSLIPSLNLIDASYGRNLKNSQVLAMGASEWQSRGFELDDLPAVPLEISAITSDAWRGQTLLNEKFTPENLNAERRQQPFRVIHLATHGEFQPGRPGESYIQFWNSKLGLDQIRNLQLRQPPVELLTLSACRTALGDEQAELGFAGLAMAAGVKTTIASLWYVSDVGTLSLMTEFYRQLRRTPIKAEAIQQAQIAVLNGQVRLEGNQLVGPTGAVTLPVDKTDLLNEQLAGYEVKDLRHPYFWAAFTMVGSPW